MSLVVEFTDITSEAMLKKTSVSKMDNIFLPKNKIKGKKKKRPPYWLQKRTPAGPETEVFFRVA